MEQSILKQQIFTLEKNILNYSFSTDQLAPDKYYVDFLLLEYNHNMQKRHDLVKKVMFFFVEEVEHKYNMKWLPKKWGHVVLERIHLLDR